MCRLDQEAGNRKYIYIYRYELGRAFTFKSGEYKEYFVINVTFILTAFKIYIYSFDRGICNDTLTVAQPCKHNLPF